MTDTLLTNVPVLPLRDMVVYPHGVHPLFVGTPSSIKALDAAMTEDKQILLIAKRDPEVEVPSGADLFEVGTIATVLQLLKLPDGTVKVLVEGGSRARVLRLLDRRDEPASCLLADVETIAEPEVEHREADAIVRRVLQQFEQYIKASRKVPQEVLSSLTSIDDPARLIDTIAAQISMNMGDRQSILECFDLKERMDSLLGFIDAEIDVYCTRAATNIRGVTV